MSVSFFIPFHLTSSRRSVEFTASCAAHKKDEQRCRKTIAGHQLHRIHELHKEILQTRGKEVNDEDLKNKFVELASICLCSSHKLYKEAAVYQWQHDFRSAATNTFIDQPEPATPRRENIEFKFKPFCGTIANDVESEPRGTYRSIDTQIIDKLMKRIEHDPRESDYLYLFGHKNAPGVYKVGRTTTLERFNQGHKRCYPGLVIYSFSYCPNSELFERLVQSEFLPRRRMHECHCHTTHGEWFEVPLEDLSFCLTTWVTFARLLYCGDTKSKIANMTLRFPGTSLDPVRWRDWARDWIHRWSGNDTAGHGAQQRPAPDTPPESPPGLSSGSEPATPDNSYLDPATPTPASRIKRDNRQALYAVRDGSPSSIQSPTEYFSAEPGVVNDDHVTNGSGVFCDPTQEKGSKEPPPPMVVPGSYPQDDEHYLSKPIPSGTLCPVCGNRSSLAHRPKVSVDEAVTQTFLDKVQKAFQNGLSL
ncbi:hypothetical protein BDV18DRAFT_3683 [Aspergillus unguis]